MLDSQSGSIVSGKFTRRRRGDYDLLGENAALAERRGLVGAPWYRTEILPEDRKVLLARKDGPAVRDTAIWLITLVATGGLGGYFWGSLLAVPFFLVYGVMYGSASDSRWHECGHGTAFKTRWMNRAVYHLACFMIMRNPVTWRHSHMRHHVDTLIVGRDPELFVMRPPAMLRIGINFFGLYDVPKAFKLMVQQALGRIDPEILVYLPEGERRATCTVARIWLTIYAATLAVAFQMQSILPLMLVGLPRCYGAWHHKLTGVLQHGGLAEDVLDHRLNSRTMYLNPISRFIYWNMNYHIEHHMFPMVPYHALPKLHALVRHDTPRPNDGLRDACREVWMIFWRQFKDPDWFLLRDLPPTAKPYVMPRLD